MRHARLAITLAGALLAPFAVNGCIFPADTGQGRIDVHGDPNPADVGEEVVFDARGGTGYEGHKFDWDLDGDGAFETPAGFRISRTFAAPGIYSVGVDVGRPAFGPSAGNVVLLIFLHEYDSTTERVTPPPSPGNQPPMAAFAHDADPGYAETPVRFDASGSTDPEGQIVSYEWDFGDTHSDDDTLTTKSRQASYSYNYSGTYTARLKVTDAAGLTSETTRMVQVVAGTPPSSSAQAAGRHGRGRTFGLTLRPSSLRSDGMGTITNGALVRTGVIVSGRLTLGRRLRAPLNRTRKPRWISRFMIRQEGPLSNARFTVDGQMLLNFGRAGRLCVRTRSTGKTGSRDKGRLTVLGGTRRAGHVRGSGRFTVTTSAKGVPRVVGRVNLKPRRRAKRLTRECRTLVRLSRSRR